MTICSETNSVHRRTFSDLVKQIVETLRRSAEWRVAYQYEQPWKTRRPS